MTMAISQRGRLPRGAGCRSGVLSSDARQSDTWSTFGFIRWLFVGWLVRKTSEDVSNNVPLSGYGKPHAHELMFFCGYAK